MIRVVIDTNILISSLLASAGNEALAIVAIRNRVIVPCFSQPILAEYTDVLTRRKFRFKPDDIASLLAVFNDYGLMFQEKVNLVVSPDPTDTKFLHCAFACNATYLVTGNKRHFPAALYGVARVVSAGELLDEPTRDLPFLP